LDQIKNDHIGAFVFAAEDDEGSLQIWVTPTRWEQLWLQAPEPRTDEDRLNFALGRIKQAAVQGEVSVASDGARIRFVG
jgi:hypothetical protein